MRPSLSLLYTQHSKEWIGGSKFQKIICQGSRREGGAGGSWQLDLGVVSVAMNRILNTTKGEKTDEKEEGLRTEPWCTPELTD